MSLAIDVGALARRSDARGVTYSQKRKTSVKAIAQLSLEGRLASYRFRPRPRQSRWAIISVGPSVIVVLMMRISNA
jgi:hypothetical protein